MVEHPCWHCDREVDAADLTYGSRLVPRTASQGGPVLLFSCRACGAANLVETNGPGDRYLSPPLGVAGQLKGEVRDAAMLWAARNAANRAEFLSRTEPDQTRVEGPAPEPGRTAPAPSSRKEARPETDAPPPRTEMDELLEAYAIFGLKLTAKPEEIRKRYRELAKGCHPDRVADLDEEIREVAARKYGRLREAYERLMP